MEGICEANVSSTPLSLSSAQCNPPAIWTETALAFPRGYLGYRLTGGSRRSLFSRSCAERTA